MVQLNAISLTNMKWIRFFRLILALALFASIAYTTYEIVERSDVQQLRKYDDANINHMKYGMFNVNTWKEKLSNIVIAEIEEFRLGKSNKKALKEHVETQLGLLIDKVEGQIRESNKGSTKGWLRQKFIDAFVDVDGIKEAFLIMRIRSCRK